jgi:dihydroxyacetone kinase phosphotransfer subunit
MMIGLVLVSHSHTLSQGLQEMAQQVVQDRVKVAAAGGLDNVTIGTNAERIAEAIRQVYSPDGVLVLLDLSSALLSAQMAIEMLPLEWQPQIKLSGAPLVEGAMMAAIEASLGRNLEAVNSAAEAARFIEKII